jgi:predicted ATP-dependent endonuclease of OLD family
MRLSAIQLQDFRYFADLEMELGSAIVRVGPSDTGKSATSH